MTYLTLIHFKNNSIPYRKLRGQNLIISEKKEQNENMIELRRKW